MLYFRIKKINENRAFRIFCMGGGGGGHPVAKYLFPNRPVAKYLFPNRFIYGAVLSLWIAQLMNRFIPSIHHITQRLVCGVIGKALRCGTEVWEFESTHGPKSFALFSL